MYKFRRALQFAIMPVFLTLAAVSYLQPSPICTVPGPIGFLTSMWFMYAVMAAAHSGPWFPIALRLLSKDQARTAQPAEPCCMPSPDTATLQDQRSQSERLA